MADKRYAVKKFDIRIFACMMVVGVLAASPVLSGEEDVNFVPCEDNPEIQCYAGAFATGLKWSGNGSACDNAGGWTEDIPTF